MARKDDLRRDVIGALQKEIDRLRGVVAFLETINACLRHQLIEALEVFRSADEWIDALEEDNAELRTRIEQLKSSEATLLGKRMLAAHAARPVRH